MKSIFFLLFVMLTGFFANAQNGGIAAVTMQDLEQKVHPQDSSAVAAYLYRRGKTWYEVTGNYWVMVTEIYSRIKIYKKEGYEYANPEMIFYSDGLRAKGSFSDANTYNLAGGEVQKTPLQKDGEFEQFVNSSFTKKKIALPNVKEGSIVEYKYTVRTPYFGELRDFYFQFSIPANDVRYDVAIPTYFIYNVYIVGYVPIDETLPTEVYNRKIDASERQYAYAAKNVKAIKDEAYVSNIDNFTGMVKHELSIVKMPFQQAQQYATDWKTVAKKIYEDDDFGRELKFSSYFEDDIDSIMVKAVTETAKVTAIFDYVKERMNWNSQNSYMCHNGVKKAYADKVGNTAEINLMLTAMLRHAGLDANPVLVSTRSNGVAVFPTRYAYNYVIAAVTINGKTMLLDATSKYTQPDILPVHAINWKGRLIKKNGDTEEIDLKPKISSMEMVNVIAEINTDGTVTGKMRDIYQDYQGYVFREFYVGTQEETYIENLEGRYKGMVVSDYKLTNKNTPALPLTESYSFSHNRLSDAIGNKIYINPMLFLPVKENPFKEETREFPIDFIYPQQDKYLITLKIPNGYKLESVPSSLLLTMADAIGSFKYSILSEGNTVQLSMLLDISQPVVSQDHYTILKDFFKKMIEKQNEKIVLVKS